MHVSQFWRSSILVLLISLYVFNYIFIYVFIKKTSISSSVCVVVGAYNWIMVMFIGLTLSLIEITRLCYIAVYIGYIAVQLKYSHIYK